MPVKRVRVLTASYLVHGTVSHDRPFNLWLNDPQRTHLTLKEALVQRQGNERALSFTVPQAIFPIDQVALLTPETEQHTLPLGGYRLKLVMYTPFAVIQGYFPVTQDMPPEALLNTRARFLLGTQVRLHPLITLKTTFPTAAALLFIHRHHILFYHPARS